MADLRDGYPRGAAWDAMFDRAGQVRSPYRVVHEDLAEMSAGELGARAERLTRTYINQGVTFDFAGEERPFPVDVVPRVLDGAEWDRAAQGIEPPNGVRVHVSEIDLVRDEQGKFRAHDERPPPGRRDLSPGRRRVSRPGHVPGRLRARQPGPVAYARLGTVTIANAAGIGGADD